MSFSGTRDHGERVLRTDGSAFRQFRRPIRLRSRVVGAGQAYARLSKRYATIGINRSLYYIYKLKGNSKSITKKQFNSKETCISVIVLSVISNELLNKNYLASFFHSRRRLVYFE